MCTPARGEVDTVGLRVCHCFCSHDDRASNDEDVDQQVWYSTERGPTEGQGHVDAVAKVKNITIINKTWLVKLKLDNKRFNNYIVEKASISINGVSLTISKVLKNFFEVNIIPHTLELTNLKNIQINDAVNVELDIFGKYIYKYSN